MHLVNAVKEEASSIKNSIDAQNEGGNRVLQSLDGMKELITRIKQESTELLSSGEAIVKDISSLKAM
jgi:hypothetical protein